MRILQVQSRFEAARIFGALDRDNSYHSLIYQLPAVERERKNGKLNPFAGRTRSESAGTIDNVEYADGGGAVLSREQSGNRHRTLPVPRYRGEKNSLATVERLGWIVAIAIGAALSFGGLIAGLEALSRLKG
jgi:hypothetical protein